MVYVDEWANYIAKRIKENCVVVPKDPDIDIRSWFLGYQACMDDMADILHDANELFLTEEGEKS